MQNEKFTAKEISTLSGGAVTPSVIAQWIARGHLGTAIPEAKAGKPRHFTAHNVLEILFTARLHALGLPVGNANAVFWQLFDERRAEMGVIIAWGANTNYKPQIYSGVGTVPELIETIGASGGWLSVSHFIAEVRAKLQRTIEDRNVDAGIARHTDMPSDDTDGGWTGR